MLKQVLDRCDHFIDHLDSLATIQHFANFALNHHPRITVVGAEVDLVCRAFVDDV